MQRFNRPSLWAQLANSFWLRVVVVSSLIVLLKELFSHASDAPAVVVPISSNTRVDELARNYARQLRDTESLVDEYSLQIASLKAQLAQSPPLQQQHEQQQEAASSQCLQQLPSQRESDNIRRMVTQLETWIQRDLDKDARWSRFLESTAGLHGNMSVVIPNFRRHGLLKAICEQLRKQKQVNIEIIVIDDGTQPVPTWPGDDLVDTYLWHHKDGRYHRTRALMEGVFFASHEIVAFLDDDVMPVNEYWALGFIDKFRQPGVGIVRGEVQVVGLNADFWFKNEQAADVDHKFTGILPSGFFTWNMAMTKEAIRAIGGVPMEYDGFYGAEDNDMGWNVQQAGVNVARVTHGSFAYHVGEFYKLNPDVVDQEKGKDIGTRNKRIYEAKWHDNIVWQRSKNPGGNHIKAWTKDDEWKGADPEVLEWMRVAREEHTERLKATCVEPRQAQPPPDGWRDKLKQMRDGR